MLIEAGKISCVPRPTGGFPQIEGRGPFDALRHASASRLEAWNSLPPEQRFLFDVLGKLSFTERKATDITTAIEARFYEATGERGVVLLPPEPRRPDVPKEDGPGAWIACGYSQPGTLTIVEHRIFNFDRNLTVLVYGGTLLPPTYVLTLEGFTQWVDGPVVATMREILASETVRDATITAAEAGNMYGALDPATVVAHLPGSLIVKLERLRNKCIVAHVYLNPPTNDPTAWNVWRNVMRAQKYTGKLLPPAVRVRAPSRCFACHAADHEVDSCTLPATPGWRGPSLHELKERAKTAPIPAAGQPGHGGGPGQQGTRWLQPNEQRGGMAAGPSTGGTRAQRNPNRLYGRN